MNQLVITPSYPPIDSSVTLINIKIIERLEECGVNSIILTVTPHDTELPVNPRLLEIFPSNRPVYRARAFEKGGNASLPGLADNQACFTFCLLYP